MRDPIPAGRRPLYLTSEEDDDDDATSITDDGDWDEVRSNCRTPGRDPTRPSFDTSSLTAPPAPPTATVVATPEDNHNTFLMASLGLDEEEDDEEDDVEAHHHAGLRHHRWSEVTDPGIPPSHPFRSQLSPPLLAPRWTATTNRRDHSDSSSTSSSSTSTSVEGYSLGGESSEMSMSRVIAIGIPAPALQPIAHHAATTINILPPPLEPSSNTTTLETSSSHHRRELLLLHQADDEDDDALQRMPWRRNSSHHIMYLSSASDDGVGAGDDHDDEEEKMEVEWDRDQQEDMARELAMSRQELQEQQRAMAWLMSQQQQQQQQLDSLHATTTTTTNINNNNAMNFMSTSTLNDTPNNDDDDGDDGFYSSNNNDSAGDEETHNLSSRWGWTSFWRKSKRFNSTTTSVTPVVSNHQRRPGERDHHHHVIDTMEMGNHCSSPTKSSSSVNNDKQAVVPSIPSGDLMVDLDTWGSPLPPGMEAPQQLQKMPPPPPRASAATSSSSSFSFSTGSSSWSFLWPLNQKRSSSSNLLLPPERVKSGDGPQLARALAHHQDTLVSMHHSAAPLTTASMLQATSSSSVSSKNNNKNMSMSKSDAKAGGGPRMADAFASASKMRVLTSSTSIVHATTTSAVLLLDSDHEKKMIHAADGNNKGGPQLASSFAPERRPSIFSPRMMMRSRRRRSSLSVAHSITTTAAVVAAVATAATVSDDDDDDDEQEEEELEAQAGIPILLPGAFAVDGIDTLTRRRSRNDPQNDGGASSSDDGGELDEEDHDNLLDDVSEDRRLAHARQQQQLREEEATPVLSTPIEAELHPDYRDDDRADENVLVQAVDEAQEQALQTKQTTRIRTMKYILIGLAFVALLTIIIVVVVLRTQGNADASNANSGPVGWTMVGTVYSLTGTNEEIDENFGSALAIDENVTRIIVGTPGWDQGEQYPPKLGQAQVYYYQPSQGNATWTSNGQLLWRGTTEYENLGRAVAMSADGQRVAVATEDNVSIYKLSINTTSTAWQLMATFRPNSTTATNTNSDASSSSSLNSTLTSFGVQQPNLVISTTLAMSPDGILVAVGVPNAGDNNQGLVRTYALVGSIWSPIGQDIVGSTANALLGTSLDISKGPSSSSSGGTNNNNNGANNVGNGQVYRIAVGAPGFNNVGHVQIFVVNSNVWTLEQEFTGVGNSNNNANNIGQSVALSQDGLRLAIGASGSASTMGQVQVYQLVLATWVPLGSALLGTDSLAHFGSSVALSGTGNFVAVGSPYASDPITGNQVGQVQVFQLSGDNGSINSPSTAAAVSWSQLGGTIVGLEMGEAFGFTVALSADGKRVVGGAPDASYDGGVTAGVGAVRVYDSTL